MGSDLPNFHQFPVHKTLKDPQEFERFSPTAHPSVDEMLSLDLTLFLKPIVKLGHSLDVNLGSRLETIDTSTPWSLTTSFMYNFASLSIESVVLIGKNERLC